MISFLIAREENIFIFDEYKFYLKMTGRKDAYPPCAEEQIGSLVCSISYGVSTLVVELCCKLLSREMISNLKLLMIHVVMISGHGHVRNNIS